MCKKVQLSYDSTYMEFKIKRNHTILWEVRTEVMGVGWCLDGSGRKDFWGRNNVPVLDLCAGYMEVPSLWESLQLVNLGIPHSLKLHLSGKWRIYFKGLTASSNTSQINSLFLKSCLYTALLQAEFEATHKNTNMQYSIII